MTVWLKISHAEAVVGAAVKDASVVFHLANASKNLAPFLFFPFPQPLPFAFFPPSPRPKARFMPPPCLGRFSPHFFLIFSFGFSLR